MRRTEIALAMAGLLACAGLARACFLGAPWQLLDKRHATLAQAPVNSFAWEAARLASASAWRQAAPKPPAGTDEDPRAAAERAGLSAAQISALSAMRAAPDSRWALSVAGALPPAVRLYTGGAVAFLHNNMADAREYFHFVLALPPAQAAPRAVWAQYMLGRVAAKAGSGADAEAAFAAVRDLTAHGAPDPLGLATASLGEQARLLIARDDLPGAVSLYAEQAADGSGEAVQSLRLVAQHAMAQPDGLPALVAHKQVQDLLVIYALGLTGDYLHRQSIGTSSIGSSSGGSAGDVGVDGFDEPDNLDTKPLSALLAAIRTGGIPVASGDRLAALAYRLGDTDAARDLAGRSATPLALWIRAKLGLQAGNEAAPLFAAALKAAQTQATQAQATQTQAAPALEPSSIGLLRGETAVATLNRGDFVQAAEVLWPMAANYWGDFAYLAERVLTADELRRFVQAHAATPEPAASTGQDQPRFSAADSLRSLLARRLVREGRIADALPYFDPGQDLPASALGNGGRRQQAQALDADFQHARTAFWADDRARGAWEAAVTLRTNGMELMGTEEGPDQAFVDGEFEDWLGPGPTGPFADAGGGATRAEQVRYEISRPRPDLRFHYRYLAVDQAVAAASELPPRSQAFAAVLCHAAGWSIGAHDAARAAAIWRRYASQGARVSFATHFGRACPDPDFGSLWQTRRKVAELTARRAVHGHKWLVVGAAVAVVVVLGALLARRRRRAMPE